MWTHDEWNALGNILSGGGAISGAIAIVVAACIGSRTYENWRTQKLAERVFAQAETILTATYNTRRALSRVRNPMLWAAEFKVSEDNLKERNRLPEGSENEKRKAVKFNLYMMRLDAEKGIRTELSSCLPMARALFGVELEEVIEELLKQFQVVFAGASAQAEFTDNTVPNFRDEIERSLWEGYHLRGEENEMDQRIKKLVKKIELICLPKLRLER